MSKRNFGGVPVISAAGKVEGQLDDDLQVEMLGAGQEVGRSCCVIKYKGRTVVCDAGVHPAYSGMAALPFLDELDWSTVDAILITHFHLDHAAALTYIMEKTNFKEGPGLVYMSHPTKAVYKFLMSDFVRVSTAGTDDDENLFTEEEMLASWNAIIGFDFEQEILLPPSSSSSSSVRFTSFAAGHVLGACMFLIEIAGARVLYTGDYSTEEDRHLVPAKVPIWDKKPDVMICESTYGVQSHEPRLEKEAQFTTLVTNIIKRGGRVLLPVFALGRAQEILLILDEFWSEHPELHHVPIYYISNLGLKSLDVYRQYIHTMSPNVRDKFARGINPFDFKGKNSFIRPLDRGIAKLNDKNPCVVMASPGFLTNGVSRELLEKWAPDPRNGLIITGYSVEGVMARTIMNEPTEIAALNGGPKISRRLSVDYISFSAHVDYTQNAKFIDEVMPNHLILVHGEVNNMTRLRSALRNKFAERKNDVQIYTPRNVEPVKLKFRGERMAKALGSLALKTPTPQQPLSGLLVSKDFTYTLLDPSDLKDFTGLSTSVILQRQRLTTSVTWDLIKWHLQGMYGKIQQGKDNQDHLTMRIMSCVDVKMTDKHELSVEWVGSVTNDMVADSVMALLMGIDTSPASVKRTSMNSHCSHQHPHAEPPTPPRTPLDGDDDSSSALKKEEQDSERETLPSRLDRLIAFLDSYFGSVELVNPQDIALPTTTEPESDQIEKPEGETTTEEVTMKQESTDSSTTSTQPSVSTKTIDVSNSNEPPELIQDQIESNQSNDITGLTLIKQSPTPVIKISLDSNSAYIRPDTLDIECQNERLKHRVESIIQLALAIVTPLCSSADQNKNGGNGLVDVSMRDGKRQKALETVKE
ncbi:endoribonuclease ysh1 [Microbotryomycetes sp. JL221]|nr:endoribonuclease ysh1 [Microbotryomycetes sp. JL221]